MSRLALRAATSLANKEESQIDWPIVIKRQLSFVCSNRDGIKNVQSFFLDKRRKKFKEQRDIGKRKGLTTFDYTDQTFGEIVSAKVFAEYDAR